MKTLYIETDELYPYFQHYTEVGYIHHVVEVDDETAARWDRIIKDFIDYQKELRELIKYTD